MTRIAKQKKLKEKKVVGEEATPWAEMTKPVTDEKEKRREAKRLEKKRKRELKKICFRCRTAGHSMTDCPMTNDEEETKKKREVKTGMCYKCGSTEHRLNQCTVKGDSFAYATCFICGKQGHWSRLCPENPNGLYPNGGCCNECGSIQHFKRDCPTLMKKQGIDDQQLPRLTPTTANVDDQADFAAAKTSSSTSTKKKNPKRLKVVKF